jgi:hypothetical protein
MQLRELQDLFQRAILAGDDAVLGEIREGAREKREVLLGLHRDAYMRRAVKVLHHHHELLHAYLGDEAFHAMAHAYNCTYPLRHPNVRWYPRQLPGFLEATAPYSAAPHLAELALLEKSLNDAYDAEDQPVLELAELAGVAPEAWTRLRFEPHPSAIRLDFATNAAAIWAALKEKKKPPASVRYDIREAVLVWRNASTPSFRVLSAEEAVMWDEAKNGKRFGVLCEMLATCEDPDGAVVRAARYLQGWIGSGLLSSATTEL